MTSPSNARAGNYGIGAGVSSSIAAHSANASATYRIADTATSCARREPTVRLTGVSSGRAGRTTRYTVSIRNNDDRCNTAQTFQIGRSVPSGWTGALSANSARIAPGATYRARLEVTSPASARSGRHGISANVKSGAGGVHDSSASLTYTIR